MKVCQITLLWSQFLHVLIKHTSILTSRNASRYGSLHRTGSGQGSFCTYCMSYSCLFNPFSSCWFSTNLHYHAVRSAITFQINIIQLAVYNCVWPQQKMKHPFITQHCLQYKFKTYQLLWKNINYIPAKTSTDGNSANRSSFLRLTQALFRASVSRTQHSYFIPFLQMERVLF